LILEQHVPAAAAEYCLQLWLQAPFQFKLSPTRATKAGDFCARPGQPNRVTVNQDLSRHSFLITYVHEVAHHRVHARFGHRVGAHGLEWKQEFKRLMEPLLNDYVFAEPLLTGLRKHMSNPKASTYSDATITALLRQEDPRAQHVLLLSDLPVGSVFQIRDRWFVKGETKRTRVVCREHRTRRSYLVPADMPVAQAQLSLL
jgi:SprT protein